MTGEDRTTVNEYLEWAETHALRAKNPDNSTTPRGTNAALAQAYATMAVAAAIRDKKRVT